jgi:energy-coupling factor transporter ATP-binding protein EcfA2
LLLRLQKQYNITYLFITHDIATVKAISDEIVVMFQGKVVEQGLKSEILAPPFPGLHRAPAVIGPGDGSGLADQSSGRSQYLHPFAQPDAGRAGKRCYFTITTAETRG